MVTLLMLIVVALGLSLLITPLCRRLALFWGVVDVPDSGRKLHKQPMPRIGGIPLVLAYFGSYFVVAALLDPNSLRHHLGSAAAYGIAPGALTVFLVGLADDIFDLRPWHKLAGEIAAAAMVVSSGLVIRDLPILTLHPLLGALCTIAWLVACTNAVNLIDGLDGLAAGVALLVGTTMIVASLVSGSVELAVATLPLVGALLGFLVFNFTPASIFLGDSGSLLLGFLLGAFSILWSATAATFLGMSAPLMALAIPLLDTGLAIIRRFLRGQPIFAPDRSHIHHQLLSRGLTPRRAVLLLYIVTGVSGSLSLILSATSQHWAWAIIGVFACAVGFGVHQLRYVEFHAAGSLMAPGGFRRALNARLAVEAVRQGLLSAVTPHDCWTVIQGASRDFGFHQIRMQLAGKRFEHHNGPAPAISWDVWIRLSEQEWIALSCGVGPHRAEAAVVSFVDTVTTIIGSKTPRRSASHSLPAVYPEALVTATPTYQSVGVHPIAVTPRPPAASNEPHNGRVRGATAG